MEPCEGWHRGNLFVDDGVVLHSTATERVEAVVHAEVVVTVVGIMSDYRQLVTLRQLSVALTAQSGRK